jgi:hypothetical protein
MTINRRTFVIQSLFGTVALTAGNLPHAGVSMLIESDPQASNLGYKDDAAKVDTAKFKNYSAGQKCAECRMFKARPDTPTGTCAIFSGKLVKREGWCISFVRKA